MREEPPRELISLVERLGLAAPGQVCRLGRSARRLARGLPLFESVWVDALAQARVVTRFQAEEIKAGRGEALRVGPYVLRGRLPSPGYTDCYLARETESGEVVRLAVVRPSPGQASDLVGRLEALVAKSESLDSPVLIPITRVGIDGDRVWAGSRHVAGRTASEWMVRGGRFPPHLVLEIARQMLAGLASLEEAGLCHGDIGASSLILTDRGDVVLPQPGLRHAIRPEEAFSQPDLLLEEYDYMAPERVGDGAPASAASDMYACGCLWWHLLVGRPPVPGGDRMAKLRAVQTFRVPDVLKLAPDTPKPLAAAISASLERDPSSRPESMARLGEIVGPPARAGRVMLGSYLERPRRLPAYCDTPTHPARGMQPAPSWLTATAACLVALVVIAWAVWRFSPSASAPSAATAPLSAADAMAGPVGPAAVENVPHPDAEAAMEPRIDDLVLPSGGPLAIGSLDLQPGQCVRGESDSRPLVVVPEGGLVVRDEGVRFENIDFVWDGSARPAPSGERDAILHVTAARAEFRGCSFQAADTATRRPVAVRWTHPADRDAAELSLFSGQLQLSDCVLRRVSVGVACETLGALSVEMANVLSLDSGPAVELDHCPEPDEPVLIGAANVTLRDAGPLLECRYGQVPDRPGAISIQANACALATRPDAGLLSFVGPGRPERILSKIGWNGQGSLVLPEAVIAVWRRPDGDPQTLDDALVSIAGLVRSEVGFSGPAESGPSSSRLVRWQAPLRSPHPPGIDPAALAWPKPVPLTSSRLLSDDADRDGWR
ncbi:MAG: protein kinase [Planctomycetota bacterium]